MTLYRQLFALILLIASVMAIGALFISIENTRSYLTLQLATQTQNAADSLGLSLVPHMKNRDIAAMDTMINAVFDSGYYKSLSLTTMAGKSLIERRNTSHIEGVPQWFINTLTLKTASAASIITTGWTQAGKLNLVAHPGFAYTKLWKASIEMLWWSLMVFVISFALASLLLKTILKPLNAVEQQALDICKREFPVVKDIPKTRELKRVVLAMNKMSAKLQALISKLSKRAEQARSQIYYDELTGLMNRKGFHGVANHAIKDAEQCGSGYIAIIRLSNLAHINRQLGHHVGDEWLKKISSRLTETCGTFHAATAARIAGIDFAVILPLANADMAEKFGQSLSKALETLSVELSHDGLAHIGIAAFDQQSVLGDILADADVALALAQHHGAQNYHIQSTRSEARGNIAWNKLIHEALSQNNISFLSQPVMTPSRERLYSEVLIRIKDISGQDISPASFSSMAERTELSQQLDQYVIEHVTGSLEQNQANAVALAVNISSQSIRDGGFSFWLQQHLRAHPLAASSLYFEISEHGALQDIEASYRFINLVHLHGGRVVMERFGALPNSFQTLRQLKVDYIKLDGSYMREVATSSENRTFLQSIVDIAQSLDIQVIAEHVETAEDADSLKALGISAMQGYYFGKPDPMT